MASFHTIDKEIEEYMSSGKYPVVNLDIFKQLEHIEISEMNKDHIQYTLELYKNYLDNIEQLPENYRIKFLETLKAAEIMDNQKLEQENSFLISLYMTVMGNNSIDEIIKINKNQLKSEDIIVLQKLLLEGTPGDKKETIGYRQNNRSFVGRINNGVREIQYFPLRYNEIEQAVEKFTAYYNQPEVKDTDIFIKPFIIHGLLASLQCFRDGNTRLSRLLQHTKLWHLTNDKLDTMLPTPAIYISRSYYPYRNEYREKIKNIVINMDDHSWNDWFSFNLNRLEDQLYYIDNNLEQFKKIL